MGKYLPILITAECGSLSRAGQILGYAQPNLGHIVTRFENELGVKLFTRDQRGVRLTAVGERLLELMGQVEALETQMQEIARSSKGALLRVGVFAAAAEQWMPEVIERFRQECPDTLLELVYLKNDLEGELGLKNGTLDCCFSTGLPPVGVRSVPLLQVTYFLAVSEHSPLAKLTQIRPEETAGRHPFIAAGDDWGWDDASRALYQKFARGSVVKNAPQCLALALVARDVGVSIVSDLEEIPPGVKCLPFQEPVTRTVSLLCAKEPEQGPLFTIFLRLLQRKVETWQRGE
ncbi:MAG: LysR family transcriptional regulator [Ruminiclostridium sp.]|jgi:DNA-binding transcriptional LysR family regulator|nr:LysR family transcriptional regulator [Ruminiclostridium sp.]